MRGKPYTSREKEIISNVYSYFKANNPLENKAYLIRKTAEATKSSFGSVRRISEESDDGKGHKSTFNKIQFVRSPPRLNGFHTALKSFKISQNL